MEYVGAWTGSMEPLVDASEPILDSSAPGGDTAKRGPEALVAAGKRSLGFQVMRRSDALSGARSKPAQHRVRPCLPASSLKCRLNCPCQNLSGAPKCCAGTSSRCRYCTDVAVHFDINRRPRAKLANKWKLSLSSTCCAATSP